MTTLRVVLDPLIGPPSLGGRYAERLTRALASHAPEGSRVDGVISAIPDEDAAAIEASIRGLGELHRARLARRELRAAWQHGITLVPGTGLLHATDLTAPLSRHDRERNPDSQTVVTVHDTVAWTRPESLDPREAGRRRAMGARVARYADAVVVPTHAVADALGAELGIGARIRVIAAAPRAGLGVPEDTAAVRAGLGVPERYVVTVLPDDAAHWESRADTVLSALSEEVRLVVVAPAFAELGEDEAPPTRRVQVAGPRDRELAAVLAGAAAYVDLGAELGFGIPALEAFALGIPVVHVGAGDADELLADAGLRVDDPGELGDAVRSVLDASSLADRLSTLGRDRASVFSWRDSAEKVWQLHADL